MAQREIEAAGFPTVTLSPIYKFTASVSPPRLVAVEHPNGVTMGPPGDVARQSAVLRGTLRALSDIAEPGGVVHLPYTWPDDAADLETEPEQPPPIVGAIIRRPWLFRRLLSRDFPDSEG